MIIRQAEKKDVKEAIPLLIMALDEMKTVFSGYEDEEKIISKYEEFFYWKKEDIVIKTLGFVMLTEKLRGL